MTKPLEQMTVEELLEQHSIEVTIPVTMWAQDRADKLIKELARRLAEAKADVRQALGFAFAYCATWEATGRRVGELEAPKILDAWDKANGADEEGK